MTEDDEIDFQLRKMEVDVIRQKFKIRHRDNPEGGDIDPARMTGTILRILDRLRYVWQKDPQFEADWDQVAMGHYITAGHNTPIWPYLWHEDNLQALEAIADMLWRHSPKEIQVALRPNLKPKARKPQKKRGKTRTSKTRKARDPPSQPGPEEPGRGDVDG